MFQKFSNLTITFYPPNKTQIQYLLVTWWLSCVLVSSCTAPRRFNLLRVFFNLNGFRSWNFRLDAGTSRLCLTKKKLRFLTSLVDLQRTYTPTFLFVLLYNLISLLFFYLSSIISKFLPAIDKFFQPLNQTLFSFPWWQESWFLSSHLLLYMSRGTL